MENNDNFEKNKLFKCKKCTSDLLETKNEKNQTILKCNKCQSAISFIEFIYKIVQENISRAHKWEIKQLNQEIKDLQKALFAIEETYNYLTKKLNN